MLTWPHRATDWAERLEAVYPAFLEIGKAIADHEYLVSVCESPQHVAHVRAGLLQAGAREERLLFSIAPSNDSWARDHGPLTTIDLDQAALNHFVFNGWGSKFEASLDAAIAAQLHDRGAFADAPMHSHHFVLEGGAIETDGQGTLLATRSSVISESRNPGRDPDEIERLLTDWLGFDRYLWLDHGDISGDDTDGHIDTLARFADPDTILYVTAPPGDRDHDGLDAMARQLGTFRTRAGHPYRLLPLPFPGVLRDSDGRRLPATYANFLAINGAVLLPVYGVPTDAEAIAVIRSAFAGRQVIPIDCREIIKQNGSLHCLTMQFPAQLELRDTMERVAR